MSNNLLKPAVSQISHLGDWALIDDSLVLSRARLNRVALWAVIQVPGLRVVAGDYLVSNTVRSKVLVKFAGGPGSIETGQ